MKRIILIKLLVLTAIVFGSFSSNLAQPQPPPGNQFGEQPRRPNLLQALGLTQDQIRQLRQLNISLQPQLRESERNMRQSKQALDEAIYAEETSDSLIQERLQTFQKAQAEVAKNRTMMESSVRKILTREQLLKFRQLRQNFQPKQTNPEKRPNQPKRLLPNKLNRPTI